ncbi:hypothetical protein B566_EDAN012078 [Ephemera danica]|nr:hypothetical protein B566_EDAN012078 [Ephemera danica]
MISFGTTANVVIEEPKLTEQPEDHRNDTVIVLVNFHGRVPQIEVQLWVIIVSAIAGVFLLLLLILGLTKTLADSAVEPLNVSDTE